jgi:phosphopantetheinyl transferase (holo-ACP synthase)
MVVFQILGYLLLFSAFLGLPIFFILGLYSLFKKNGKAKKNFLSMGGSFIAIVVLTIILSSPNLFHKTTASKVTPFEEIKKEETPAQKTLREAKEKALREARVKAMAEKKANAQPIEYAKLEKNPDRHEGEYVKYQGQIIQILEDNESTQLRLSVTKDEWGYNVDDIIWVEYDGLTDFVEEDIVTIYGEISGSYSYTSQAGWEISIPGLVAESIE